MPLHCLSWQHRFRGYKYVQIQIQPLSSWMVCEWPQSGTDLVQVTSSIFFLLTLNAIVRRLPFPISLFLGGYARASPSLPMVMLILREVLLCLPHRHARSGKNTVTNTQSKLSSHPLLIIDMSIKKETCDRRKNPWGACRFHYHSPKLIILGKGCSWPLRTCRRAQYLQLHLSQKSGRCPRT